MKLLHLLLVFLISLGGTYGMYTYLESNTNIHTDTTQTVKSNDIVASDAVSNSATSDAWSLLDVEDDLINTVERIKPSVVNIYASKDVQFVRPLGRGRGELIEQRVEVGGGSGILITESGYILTNKHVVEDPESTYEIQFSDGTVAISQQAWLDPKLDIAVLKVDQALVGKRDIASFLDFDDTLQVGQFAIAIGNALAEFGHSVTLGIVSAMNRTIALDDNSIYAGLIQTDTSISQGNSGGPLFDSAGQVIGINTAVSAIGENIGFALPVTQQFVQATLTSIIQNDAIIRPFVGISYLDLDGRMAEEANLSRNKGVYISGIVPGSAADNAGLQEGDIITHMQGYEMNTNKTFMYHLYTYTPGDSIEIRYIRDERELELTLVLGR